MSSKPKFAEIVDIDAIETYTPLRLHHGQWRIGEIACADLAAEYGTPVFVSDGAVINRNCDQIRQGFDGAPGGVLVCYAAKAGCNPAILNVIQNHGFGAEVASEAELCAVRAYVPPERIVYNGNAKKDEQLRSALLSGVKAIIVDSPDELGRLAEIAFELGVTAPYAVRVNLGMATGGTWDMSHISSKFGTPYKEAKELYLHYKSVRGLRPIGLHCHLGSQISSEQVYFAAVEQMVSLLVELAAEGIHLEFLDLGGGFPVRSLLWSDYTASDQRAPSIAELEAQFDFAKFGPRLNSYLQQVLERHRLAPVLLIIEPGRSVLMNSGVLLTTVQTRKPSLGAERPTWLSVDGGCHTLPDCWIYDWFFECLPIDPERYILEVEPCNIAGPLCDSGDVLGRQRLLPTLRRGDVLAFLQVGGYYAETMQSTFHLLPRAPVVWVEATAHRVIQPREWYSSQQSLFGRSSC